MSKTASPDTPTTALQTFEVRTRSREELVSITSQVRDAISATSTPEGVAYVYCPHTTGAITIQESADPDVARDLDTTLSRLVPERGDYRHAEGNADAHVKSALVGSSQVLLVQGGRPLLGTWQGVFFCEFDGPRTRKVHVKVIAG